MNPMIMLGAVLVVGLIIFGLVLVFSRRTSGLNREHFSKRWDEIANMYGRSAELYPQAIIKADSLLDEALKKLRYPGKTMGERLVSANRIWTDTDAVWKAHKTRNRLVHESNAKVNRTNTATTLKSFKRALKDLGAL